MGSVTYMGEVYDAQTGELLATFLNKRSVGSMPHVLGVPDPER